MSSALKKIISLVLTLFLFFNLSLYAFDSTLLGIRGEFFKEANVTIDVYANEETGLLKKHVKTIHLMPRIFA